MWQINELRHIPELYGWMLCTIDVRFNELFDKCMAGKLDDLEQEEFEELEELGKDIECMLDELDKSIKRVGEKLDYLTDLYTD